MSLLSRALVVLFISDLLLKCAADICADASNTTIRQPKFWAIRHCQRSNLTQLGQANYARAEQCADLARRRQALAFNFAPPARGVRNRYDRKQEANPRNYSIVPRPTTTPDLSEFFNCEVLACPEFATFSHMINDTRYDYYTMYARPPPPPNATCLPTVGVFLYYHRFANYSVADGVCRQPISTGGSSGTLANVLSSRRTNTISAFVRDQRNDSRLDLAYIGLNQSEPMGPLYSSDGEPLDCFLYRAWAPRHPRPLTKRAGCASVTANRSWKWHLCAKQLPFVCEVFTSGPARPRIRMRGKCPRMKPT